MGLISRVSSRTYSHNPVAHVALRTQFFLKTLKNAQAEHAFKRAAGRQEQRAPADLDLRGLLRPGSSLADLLYLQRLQDRLLVHLCRDHRSSSEPPMASRHRPRGPLRPRELRDHL